MRLSKAVLALAATTAMLGGLSACSSPDPKAVDAVAAYVTANISGNVSADQAKCVGKAWVGDIGKSNLVKYGYLTSDNKPATSATTKANMSKDDAKKAADGFSSCVNTKSILSAELQKLAPTKADCINNGLTSDVVRKWLEQQFQGDRTAMLNTLQGAVGKCLPSGAPSKK